MNNTVFILILLFIPSLSTGQTFQKTFGGSGFESATSIQQITDGGYIITGITESYGVGDKDIFLIRTNSSGDPLWTKTYGGNDDDRAYSVQQTSDNGFILTGYTKSFGAGLEDVYLIKTDTAGNILWTKTYGGSGSERGWSVEETSDAGYIIAGYSNSFGAGLDDIYLIKTDPTGNLLWTKTYGGDSTEIGYFVQQTVDGGYIISGCTNSFGGGLMDVYLIKTTANGDTMWTRTYGGTNQDCGNFIQQTVDSGYIVAGFTSSFGAGDNDIYVIKTSSTGDTMWTRTYGGNSLDLGFSVRETTDGGYIVTGVTSSFGAAGIGGDVYLVKTSSNGDTLWTKTYGDTLVEWGLTVLQTTNGGYIIGGMTSSFGEGSTDIYLIKTDANGNSGCKQFGTNTSVSNPSTLVGSGVNVGNPATTVNGTGTVVNNNPMDGCNVCDTLITNFGYTDSFLTVNFSDSSTNASSWSWDFGDATTDSVNNPTHNYDSSGTYNVTLIVGNCSASDTITRTITIQSTSIDQFQSSHDQLTVYPNPTSGKITLDYNLPQIDNVSITVYNVTGELVHLIQSKKKQIDLSDLPNGIYMLHLRAGETTVRRKIIKL